MADRSLGILLARAPETVEARLALDLARESLARGTRVGLFLMWEGVGLLHGVDLTALAEAGAHVAVCSQTAASRRCPLDRPGVDYASQYRLAQFVSESDRFVSLA
jgi:sulfur relay (sulfurtransferase) complex TusBCD TusD component (DsrE family)